MVLVHHQRNLWPGLDRRLCDATQERFAGVTACAGGRLQYRRAIGLGGCLHDGLDLLHVVDVERRNTVAELGRMIEKLPERDECHADVPM